MFFWCHLHALGVTSRYAYSTYGTVLTNTVEYWIDIPVLVVLVTEKRRRHASIRTVLYFTDSTQYTSFLKP